MSDDHKLMVQGHRERLRSRFIKSATAGMHDYEVLELILTYSIPRRDVKPIAKRLIDTFGSFARVLDGSFEELQSLGGLGLSSATHLKLFKEAASLYLLDRIEKRNLLTSTDRIANFGRMKLSGSAHEVFMALFLNTRNELIGHEIMNEGTVDQVAVYPRRIIEKALERHAAGLIIIHNHPSGHTDPSEEDKRLTKRVKESAEVLDVQLVDHIIVGRSSYFSFAAAKLIEDKRA